MKRYETIFITLPDLVAEDRDDVLEKLKTLIAKEGGTIVKFDEWGIKNLAYEIKKQARGYYVYVDYAGGSGLVKELERVMSIDDRIMKYMTVLTDKEYDPASVEPKAESDSAPDAPVGSEVSEEMESASTDTNSEEGA